MQSLLWTFPAIMFASIVIGWAAEVAALHLSAGLALAILALLQTLPEFGVEAFISWSGNQTLMLANLTGSLRLFVGFGWPMVFFIHAFSQRFGKTRRWPTHIQMPLSFSTEATFLFFPILYFLGIAIRGNITSVDGIALVSFYCLYLVLLNYQRLFYKNQIEESEHDLDFIPTKIVKFKKPLQLSAFMGMFFLGGLILYIAVHPFVEGLKLAALSLGMTEFVFIQWVAPFASEMPEKITAFGWARKARKVPMAIFNMVSSSVNQWTLLAGLVPIIYSLSPRFAGAIEFNQMQQTELALTIAQSVLGALFLADLKFHFWEAIGLFVLWLIQFFLPQTREQMMVVYVIWSLVELGRLIITLQVPRAWMEFYKMIRRLFLTSSK